MGLEQTSLAQALTLAFGSSALGFGIAYALFYWAIGRKYGPIKDISSHARIKYWCGLIATIFLGLGISTALNEFLSAYFNNNEVEIAIIERGIFTAIAPILTITTLAFFLLKITKDNLQSSQLNNTSVTSAASSPIGIEKNTMNLVDEDSVYEIIANEIESGRINKGLWTRLFVEFDGDDKKTKIAYIKQRVGQLMSADRTEIDEAPALKAVDRDANAKSTHDLGEDLRIELARRIAVESDVNFEVVCKTIRLLGGSVSWQRDPSRKGILTAFAKQYLEVKLGRDTFQFDTSTELEEWAKS